MNFDNSGGVSGGGEEGRGQPNHDENKLKCKTKLLHTPVPHAPSRLPHFPLNCKTNNGAPLPVGRTLS